MPEPITLAVVALPAITEGIKFLYGQANEALKRWHEHKDAANKPATVPASAEAPPIFKGTVAPLQIHLDKVAELETQLKDARNALIDYAQNGQPVTKDNADVLQQTDALRQIMEAVFQYRLKFQGEPGEDSGPQVIGTARIDEIRGHVAGLKAGTIASGSARGEVTGKLVTESGQAFGVEVDRIG